MIAFFSLDAQKYGIYLSTRVYRYHESDDFEDIKSESMIGLIAAVDHFDPLLSNGCSFWTYMSYWVKAYVQRFIYWRKAGPATVSKNVLRNSKFKPRTTAISAFVPNEFDAGNVHEITEDRMMYEFQGFAESSEKDAEHNSRMSDLWAVAERELSPNLLYILRAHFIEGRTLNQIGAEFNLSRERIRQRQVIAIKKLRRALGVE